MNKLLLALSLSIASFTASAQTLIPLAGGNLSWYWRNGFYYSPKSLTGFNAGLLVDLRASSSFSLQTGFQYVATGGNYNANSNTYPRDDQYRKRAIQLPVQLVLKIGDEERQHFFLGGGFYLAKNFDYIRQIDFGLGGGAGYRFAFGLELYTFYQRGYWEQAGLSVRYAIKLPKRKSILHGQPVKYK